jgi:hypothetical protein
MQRHRNPTNCNQGYKADHSDYHPECPSIRSRFGIPEKLLSLLLHHPVALSLLAD